MLNAIPATRLRPRLLRPLLNSEWTLPIPSSLPSPVISWENLFSTVECSVDAEVEWGSSGARSPTAALLLEPSQFLKPDIFSE